MTREEAKAYFDNLRAVAHKIVEFMRENGLTYSETKQVLEYADTEIGAQMLGSKI